MPYFMCFWDLPSLISCAFSVIPIFLPFNSQKFLFTCLCSFFTCLAVFYCTRLPLCQSIPVHHSSSGSTPTLYVLLLHNYPSVRVSLYSAVQVLPLLFISSCHISSDTLAGNFQERLLSSTSLKVIMRAAMHRVSEEQWYGRVHMGDNMGGVNISVGVGWFIYI